MMDLAAQIPTISLLALVLAIAVGFWTKINLGIIGVALAFVVGHFLAGMESSSIYLDGWPINLFFMLLGMTLLFGIAKLNGTFSVVAKQIASLSFGNKKLLCLIVYLLSAVIASAGVGTIVTPAILLPLIVELAREEDMPENLVILLCIAGSIAGGLSPIAPTGVIGISLGASIGLENYTSIFLVSLGIYSVQALLIFLAFGGLKLKKGTPKPRPPLHFERNQWLTVAVLVVVILCVLVLKFNLGLTAFTGVAVLLVFKAADEGRTIANVAWSTLLLICGVSMLVNVIKANGGIDLMAEYLTAIMTVKTAPAIMTTLAGLMSTVSSASGVVMPTLYPTIPGITANLGGDLSPALMSAAVVVGSHAVTYSPLSTMGALGMANASERSNKQKLFMQFLGAAFALLILTSSAFLAGFFDTM